MVNVWPLLKAAALGLFLLVKAEKSRNYDITSVCASPHWFYLANAHQINL